MPAKTPTAIISTTAYSLSLVRHRLLASLLVKSVDTQTPHDTTEDESDIIRPLSNLTILVA